MKRLLLIALLPLSLTSLSCGRSEAQTVAAGLTGGDPYRGKVAIKRYGCDTCHTIPGIRGANAVVGPSLERLGARTYVRHLPNTPGNLILWIRHPKRVFSETPMPELGVTEQDARDIAAYLYTLR
jgi:cytochrome c